MFICRKRASRYPIFLFGRMPMPNEGSHSTARRPGRRICSGKTEGLNEQGRSRDHESSDEGDQTRKQHYVAQEHTHTRLPLHLFCAGRLASAKVRPLQSPDSRMMKLAKRPNPAPPAGGSALSNLCVVVLRPSRCSFAETRTRVPKHAYGIAAHCAETCPDISGV